MADGQGAGNAAGNAAGMEFLYHPAIEVSLTSTLEELRHLAYEATPGPAELFNAQRALLRTATARISRKGISTDTESYRRLGILIPHWKHPAQFEAVLHALQDYWKRHRTARSLGRSAPYRKVRQKAGNYLRRLARGEDNEEEEDGEDEEDDDDDCTLPTATMVRVFRLVNGNLEIPPTLFKALAVAGRIQDVFFPDEPGTWEQGPLRDNNTDAGSEASFNGTQTDVLTADSSDDSISGDGGDGGSDNSGWGDNDDDDNVIFVGQQPVDNAQRVNAQVMQAMNQFLEQMQMAAAGNSMVSSADNSLVQRRSSGRPASNGSGGWGGVNFSAIPAAVSRMFSMGGDGAINTRTPNSFTWMHMPGMNMPMPKAMPIPVMVMPVMMDSATMAIPAGVGAAMVSAMQGMPVVKSSGSESASGSTGSTSASRQVARRAVPSSSSTTTTSTKREVIDFSDAGSQGSFKRFKTSSSASVSAPPVAARHRPRITNLVQGGSSTSRQVSPVPTTKTTARRPLPTSRKTPALPSVGRSTPSPSATRASTSAAATSSWVSRSACPVFKPPPATNPRENLWE